MLRATVFAALMLSATSAWSSQEASPQLALTAGDFAAQRAQIEQDLADGKTYAEISTEDRAKVRESLDRISGALDGAGTVDALSDDAKARVFNDQEQINQILTVAKEDSRLVCTREAPTGSNRKITTCQTVAERNRRRDIDQAGLREYQRAVNGVQNN